MSQSALSTPTEKSQLGVPPQSKVVIPRHFPLPEADDVGCIIESLDEALQLVKMYQHYRDFHLVARYIQKSSALLNQMLPFLSGHEVSLV